MFSFKSLMQEKKRPLVMGVLNITPDSFSDGGKFNSLSSALERLDKLYEEGADIIDIGACSTAPKNQLADGSEELRRLALLPELVKRAKVPVSVDTFRPEAVKFALECGVNIINDESGFFNEEIAAYVKQYGCGWVFMHTAGADSKCVADYENGVVDAVAAFFKEMREKAISFGIDSDCLCYDYGIGFGKSRSDDVCLMRESGAFGEFTPLLVGASRKRVIGEITGRVNAEERVAGSVAAAVCCAQKGAVILRVHDVKETVDALKTVDILL